MRFEKLHLKAFGAFTDRVLDFSAGSSPLHLVYGPNESGKSTCLRAIESFLFGMPRVMSDDYVHPYRKLRVGATLVSQDGQSLSLMRRKTDKNSLFYDDDETPADENQLSAMMGGLGRDEFRSRFGLSYEQLVEGGQAVLESRGDLGQLLFAAGAGIARLQTVSEALDAEARALFLERGKKSTLNAAIRELDDSRKQLRELQLPPAEYDSLRQSLAGAKAKSERLTDEIQDVATELGQQQRYLDAASILPIYDETRSKLEALVAVPMLDDEFAAKRREASAHRAASEANCIQHRKTLEELTAALARLQPNAAVLAHADEIVELFQAIATRQVAARDQAGLRRVASNHQRHLRKRLRELGAEVDDQADVAQVDALIESLRVGEGDQLRINELAAQYERIRQQVDDSAENVETMRKQLAEIDDELERHPASPDPQAIDAVLTDVGAPDALSKTLAQHQSDCDDLQFECDRTLSGLRIGSLGVEQAVVIATPSDEKIDAFEQQFQQETRTLEETKSELAKIEAALQTARGRLEHLQQERPLPTEADLSEHRRQRDTVVEQLGGKELAAGQETTRQLSALIRQADETVDKIRSHHELVAQRNAVVRDVHALEQEQASVAEKLASLQTAATQSRQAWQGFLADYGLPQEDVRGLRHWLANHKALNASFQSLRDARHRRDEAQDRINRACSRLAGAIKLATSQHPVALATGRGESATWTGEPSEEASLDELHVAAITMRNELAAAFRQRESWISKRAELLAEIPKAESTAESRRQQWERWQQEWSRAIQGLAGGEETGPTIIHARLKNVTEMLHEQRERDIVRTRIDSIDRDDQQFEQHVRSIAELVGRALEEDVQADQLAKSLYDQLQSEKECESEQRRLGKQLEQTHEKLASDSQQLEHMSAQLQALCREAGVEDEASLLAIEPRASEKRALTREFAECERQLTRIAAGRPIEEFLQEARKQDAEAIAEQISALQQRRESLREQARECEREVGGLARELDSIDGGDRAAELNQEMQFLTGRIHRDARHYARLKVARLILRQSIEHYRQANQSPVLKLACDAFRGLTCGRYTGLKPEYDDKGQTRIYGVPESAADSEKQSHLVPVDAMSCGTADAVYLAMRLASIRHQLSPESGAVHSVPVIIDDCLIQLDDDRTAAALKELSSLTAVTQVILFTHHKHLLDLASTHLDPKTYQVHTL
ncbi:MAG: AAA family ATPase [Planctomycetota bacterium]